MASLNLWQLPGFDPYRLLFPFLVRLDPEKAHTLALKLLEKGWGPKDKSEDDPILHTSVCNLQFRNPIGLAAGFDKQCKAIEQTLDLGFGFTELGGVVPLPQPGNPKPRLFRATEARAAINRFDFNSDGFDVCLQRVIAWHDATVGNNHSIVGINIAKGNRHENAADAYIPGLQKFAPYLKFVTVNVSCPNTPGLRNLEGREQLQELLTQVVAAREKLTKKPLVFVKISPDQTETQMQDIAEAALTSRIDAMIVGNTTVSRPGNLSPDFAKETGGLSGKPLFKLSTHVLGEMYKLTQGKIPLIGVGGVSSGADAYAKIRAGASLVQLYTALVFEGPGLITRIKRDLAALLKRDGFKSVSEAVGKG